jgi:hypothetical protein
MFFFYASPFLLYKNKKTSYALVIKTKDKAKDSAHIFYMLLSATA